MHLLTVNTYAKTADGTWYRCSSTEYYLPRPRVERRGMLYQNPELRAKYDAERLAPTVKRLRVGWSVDGRWCPTEKIRDAEVAKASERRAKRYWWLLAEGEADGAQA
jgi:hypothetical protein